MVFSHLTEVAVFEGLGLSFGTHGEVSDRAVQPAGQLPEQKAHYDFNLHSQQCKGQKSQ